ncbi:MAG: AAA family ATPase [Spirochaetes bacterium]|nr:AAA family ATPase [Spirochaetota bacterium]
MIDTTPFLHLDLVIICGLPCSGKSEFAADYFSNQKRKRINRNEIRRHLFEMTNFGQIWKADFFNEGDEYLVKHVERKILEHFLHNHIKVLVDNTSVSKASRKHYLEIAKHMNKTAGVIFLNTSVQTCLARNQKREDKLSPHIISNLYAKIEKPQREEGFSQVLIVDEK